VGPEQIDTELKPYWSTTSADGKNCYLSISGRNEVVVISFADETVIGRVDVGPRTPDTIVHPQRVRNGRILASVLDAAGP
jgi:hypothetical protein